MPALRHAAVLAVLAVLLTGPASAQETVGPATGLTPEGRLLQPAGRMTPLGTFPTGGALSPDGRFYWTVDAGRGSQTAVRIVDIETGIIRQTLPLPGGYVGVTFAPDGKRAYVSGQGSDGKAQAGAKGAKGDVIHVYDVDGAGQATELDPLPLPDARDGAAAGDELPPATGVQAWPEGLAVTPDGKHLVIALGQADQAAIIDLASRKATLADVGRYPYGVAIDPRRPRAYVTNERDGTVTVLEIPSGRALATIAVGGERGSPFAHAQGIAMDPLRDRAYVAVTHRDTVAVIDTERMALTRQVAVGRPEAALGSTPVTVAVAPDAATLYVALAGEDAVAAVSLEKRPALGAAPKRIRLRRSVTSIALYRRTIARYRRDRAAASNTATARRRFTRRQRAAQRKRLFGAPARACAGPTTAQDRAYALAVVRAYDARDRARSRGASKRKATSAFDRAIAAARRALPSRSACRPGALPGLRELEVIGRIPTAHYTTDVEVTSDGRRLVWLAAKGLGTGPNNGAETNIDRLLLGRAGVLSRPTDTEARALTARADKQLVPTNAGPPPANTPIGAPGSPSSGIKHVFYVVRENRAYDQIFGSETRGRGDPRLQVFDDNNVPGPTGGVTPNAHALARRFGLLDNTYANSEESTAGHKITAGGYINDYAQRFINVKRGRKGNPDTHAIGNPPNAYIFDQAARQGLSFRAYGELGAGNQPFADDGRPTFQQVLANTDPVYPSQVAGTCRPAVPGTDTAPNPVRCTADAGEVGATAGPPATQSRIRTFAAQFREQLAAGAVPRFNYLILFNDHTDGTTPGVYTPKANVADNDLALGQLVELVSQSAIWSQSAILVVEDDSQDGIDSVDAHRIPALVISPWAKRGGVVSTRFDQYSFLRTAELILGLNPLSINDALATPLYDAFISGSEQPDVEATRYRAIQPQQSLTQVNPANAAEARLSASLPFDQVDLVPQRLADRIIWRSVFGADAPVPPAGPNASSLEQERTRGALREIAARRSARAWLLRRAGEGEDETREEAIASLLAFGSGLSVEEAEERIEELEAE